MRLITLHGIRSKVSKVRHSYYIRSENTRKIRNQSEMAISEAIQSVFIQVAIHEATATVVVMRETDEGPVSGADIVSMWKHADKGIAD